MPIKHFLLILLLAISAPGFCAGFMKFDGIEGESKDSEHKDWIDILSVSQSAATRDAASGMASGKRQHKPVTVTKPIDKASPILAKALSSGEPINNVKIKTGGQVTVLKHAIVTEIKRDRAGNELITLTPAEAPERKKGNVETTWKVEKGE